MANTEATPLRLRILRLALAGFCIGVNVMEAADVGALCSIFIAAHIFYRSLVQPSVALGTKIFNGVWNVGIVAVCAGFLAVQVVTSLLGQGFTGTNTVGSQETPAAHWDWATQWSLPKAETLGAVVPGLFGYRKIRRTSCCRNRWRRRIRAVFIGAVAGARRRLTAPLTAVKRHRKAA